LFSNIGTCGNEYECRNLSRLSDNHPLLRWWRTLHAQGNDSHVLRDKKYIAMDQKQRNGTKKIRTRKAMIKGTKYASVILDTEEKTKEKNPTSFILALGTGRCNTW